MEDFRLGTVGRPLPGIEFDIAQDGEILLSDVQLKDAQGRPTHVFVPGDTVRIEMRDAKRHSIFGAIEQAVAAA